MSQQGRAAQWGYFEVLRLPPSKCALSLAGGSRPEFLVFAATMLLLGHHEL